MSVAKRPMLISVYGLGRVWRARVVARLGKTGKWRKVPAEFVREVEGSDAGVAARKAAPAYFREPRVCRRCGETWQAKRSRARVVCPRCQNRKAGVDERTQA